MASADFTIADVLAWARTKPADEEYDYCSNGNCAVAQFLKETGRAKKPRVHPEDWYDGKRGKAHDLDYRISCAANNSIEQFGEFVRRLERIAA